MINLSLTDEQAKALLIITGNSIVPRQCGGVFTELKRLLHVVSDVPDPVVNLDGNTVKVTQALLDSVKTR